MTFERRIMDSEFLLEYAGANWGIRCICCAPSSGVSVSGEAEWSFERVNNAERPDDKWTRRLLLQWEERRRRRRSVSTECKRVCESGKARRKFSSYVSQPFAHNFTKRIRYFGRSSQLIDSMLSAKFETSLEMKKRSEVCVKCSPN